MAKAPQAKTYTFDAIHGGFKIDEYGEAKLTLKISAEECLKMAELGQLTEVLFSVAIVPIKKP